MSFTFLAADAPAASGGMFGSMGAFVPMILIFVMFYFILIRPQRQQQKRLEETRKGVGNGDKVITVGGIHGIVTGVTDKTVSVKIADGLSVKFDRSAIATVLDSKTKKEDDSVKELDDSSK